MRVKYLGKIDTVALEKDKLYEVISIEDGWFRIMTELGEDYLFPPEYFEIIDDNTEQKTIHEKWEESDITILPPKKLTKKEIKEKLQDPNLSNEEKNELVELLYEGIDVLGQ